MEYRALGNTGLKVSAIGFGCGAVGGLMVRGEVAEQRRAVEQAILAGINYFDTAPSYGAGRSEETIGPLLNELRAPVYLGTKVRLAEEAADKPAVRIRRSIEASLRRLGRERIDLLQLHDHVRDAGPADIDAVLGPIAEGLNAVREAGLTRFIGFTGLGDVTSLHRVAQAGIFDTVQCYVNALNPSAGWTVRPSSEQDFCGLIGLASAAGLGVIAIRVLAAGAIAGPERHHIAGSPGRPLVEGGVYEANVVQAGKLAELAASLGLEGAAELSYRLVLSHHGVSTALAGVSEVSHIEAALRWERRGPLDAAAVESVLGLVGA